MGRSEAQPYLQVTVPITHFSAQRQHRGFVGKVPMFFAGSEGLDTASFGAEKYWGCATRELFLRGFAGKSHLANLQPGYISQVKICTGNRGLLEQDSTAGAAASSSRGLAHPSATTRGGHHGRALSRVCSPQTHRGVSSIQCTPSSYTSTAVSLLPGLLLNVQRLHGLRRQATRVSLSYWTQAF